MASPKQKTQRNLSFLLRRVTGMQIIFKPEAGMYHSDEFIQYKRYFEQARENLEHMIRHELKNIQTIEEKNDYVFGRQDSKT